MNVSTLPAEREKERRQACAFQEPRLRHLSMFPLLPKGSVVGTEKYYLQGAVPGDIAPSAVRATAAANREP
jgi:hypothetical protein